jgi:thiosulfate/3-mercaptopyruvate sulfurtransferase
MKTTTTRTQASTPIPVGRESVLVTGDWLAAHLSDPDLRVVEVDVNSAAYDQWHLEGAVLWNVYADLKDAEYRTVDANAIQHLLARSGIGPESTVVFYGYTPALGFWLMKLYGHLDVRILDCSRETWRDRGLPWSDSATMPAGDGAYGLPAQDEHVRADRAVVQDAIGRSDTMLVDVRSAAEYEGEHFWPSGGQEPNGRAGHVPGAVHQPIDGLYDQHGAFCSHAELRGRFPTIDLDGDGELITYCTIGARAATAWFVLTHLLGRDNVRVYDGSWAEWGRTAGVPVEAP